MDPYEQCKAWFLHGEYLKLIDKLEKNPELTKEPEYALMLATSYISISNGWKDRQRYEKAISLLKPQKKYLSRSFPYASLLGIAYLYLEQYGLALYYLQKAIRIGSKSQIMEEQISFCKQCLAFPIFTEPFRARVQKAWQAFAKIGPHVQKLLRSSVLEIREEALALSREKFEIAMAEPGIRLATGGDLEDKGGIVFSPMGQWSKFFRQCAIALQVPQSIRQNWEVLIGERPTPYMHLDLGGLEIDREDWLLWFTNTKKSQKLSTYCSKVVNSPAPKELYTKLAEGFINSSIGELPRMQYFGRPNVLTKPRKSPPILMDKLSEVLKKKGFNLSLDPVTYLEKYFVPYHLGINPHVASKPGALKPRFENLDGYTVFIDLISEYSKGQNDIANDLIACGAVAGSIFFTPPAKGPMTNGKNLAFSKKLQNRLIQKCSPHSAMKTGLAHGTEWAYIDIIAWDMEEVANVVKEFFRENPAQSYGFQVFHTEATPVYWSE